MEDLNIRVTESRDKWGRISIEIYVNGVLVKEHSASKDCLSGFVKSNDYIRYMVADNLEEIWLHHATS